MSAEIAHLPAPPHSLEAEQALIGGLMLDPQALARIAGVVSVADIYRADHRLIFKAVAAVAEHNQAPDAVTVCEYLRTQGQLEAAGGREYLAGLVQDTPSAANIRAYAEIVREHAQRRQLIALSDDIAASARSGVDTAAEIVARAQNRLVLARAVTDEPLRVLGVRELLELDLPPRADLLAPWLPRQGLAMVYARRGVGKTHFALGCAWAVVTGGEFLKWKAPEAAGVLYVDGEMPAAALQKRIARIAEASPLELAAVLDVLTPDVQPRGMPDLSTEHGQAQIDRCIRDDHGLVIVDNLSALVRSGIENDAESWQPIQTWALRHRAAGRSILFIHHAGKGGAQRGTSRREDVLDTVLQLRPPADHAAEDGATFDVLVDKARGLHGDAVAPFTASLGEDANGRQIWTVAAASADERVIPMVLDGMSGAEIATELDLNRSTVYRRIRQAIEDGKLPETALPRRSK